MSPTALLSLLRRYIRTNLVLQGYARLPTGKVDTVTFAGGLLQVDGQYPTGGDIALELGDMSSRMPLPARGGAFRLSLPWPPSIGVTRRQARLVTPDGQTTPISLSHPLLPVLRLGLRFGQVIISGVPDLWAWMRRRDLGARTRLKDALGLGPQRPGGPLDPGLRLVPCDVRDDSTGAHCGPATIVLPVFNAFDLLQTCLTRLTSPANMEADWHLVLVEDGSTDPALRPWLRDWVAAQPERRLTLIEAPENRGFLASVNTAFTDILRRPAAQTGPVILLNTDAFVPDGWLPRLLAPLLADPAVASVTPFSNDAEIFSIPAICARTDLDPGQAAMIDAVAARVPPEQACHAAPTGVGFCMAMSRHFLERVPYFDTAFGRGYGEEVDWCRKTRAIGGRHLGHAGLFVEHRGGASFGSDEKRRLVAENNALIARRYPGYDQDVQDFLLADPARSARLALALAWVGTSREEPVPVYLAHSLGGGAEHWLSLRIAADAQGGHGSVVLRVGGPQRWQLEVHGAAGAVIGWTEDFAQVHELLGLLPARRIVYSCGVGDSDPVSLPDSLCALHQGAPDRLEILLHDYFPISPSFTLLDARGRYHGLPKGDVPDHRTRRPDGRVVTLPEWQAAWGRLLARADLLRCFCPSSADLLTRAWPDLSDNIKVIPHGLVRAETITSPPKRRNDTACLAVLGNIAPHKGAALVHRLARMSRQARGFDMMLLGNIDPAYPLPIGFCVHGDYRPDDIPRLMNHYGITHWLIPSVWPETFSFTTHEALATDLPVLAFNIGAQGDAVAQAANGWPLPYDPQADLAALVLNRLRAEEPTG